MNFTSDSFSIQDNASQMMIGKGSVINDLYILDATPKSSLILFVSVETWHTRLGHLSNQRLDLLKDVLHCNSTALNKCKPCYVCPKAKQKKLSFDSNNKFTNKFFDLIHCDV